MENKVCRKCGLEKPCAEFYAGYGRCKECHIKATTAYHRTRRQIEPEWRKIANRIWREQNFEHRQEYDRFYKETHRLEIAAKEARRNARKRGNTESKVDYAAILERDRMWCYLCEREIIADYQFDHVIPLACGGAHSADNIKVVHPLCNQRKGMKLPEHYNQEEETP